MHVTDAIVLADSLALPAPAQPPMQYSWWVWALGLGLLLLVAAWYFWVYRYTRPKAPGSSRPDSYDGVRAEHLALVEEAHQRYISGEADLRGLHLDLNHAVRSFATARTGIDASSLTVNELTRIEHGSTLSTLLDDYSEPAFAALSEADAAAGVEQAKEVIRSW